MKLQSQIFLAGFQNLIVIGELVNISCYLDAIIFLKRAHNLSHGKTEIQFCLKQTNQCGGSEVYDEESTDTILIPAEKRRGIVTVKNFMKTGFYMTYFVEQWRNILFKITV